MLLSTLSGFLTADASPIAVGVAAAVAASFFFLVFLEAIIVRILLCVGWVDRETKLRFCGRCREKAVEILQVDSNIVMIAMHAVDILHQLEFYRKTQDSLMQFDFECVVSEGYKCGRLVIMFQRRCRSWKIRHAWSDPSSCTIHQATYQSTSLTARAFVLK